MGGGPAEDSSPSPSPEASVGYRPWWAVDKEAWKKQFSFVTKITSLRENQEEPLPPWTPADIEVFAKEDPVSGDQLKLVRQGAMISAVGGLVGGLGTAAYSYRYSRSVGGAALTLVFGLATSWAVSEEAANIGLGLYKINAMDANLKFLEWWKAKTSN